MSTDNNQKQKKSLLSRLRMAVQKVRLLISSNILSRAWDAATMLRGASLSKRHLSFNDDHRHGLMLCSSEETDSEGSVSPSRSLQRTISFPSSSDDDIDKRAEMFIANFRRQLQLERQISLQLRYRREQSSELRSP